MVKGPGAERVDAKVVEVRDPWNNNRFQPVVVDTSSLPTGPLLPRNPDGSETRVEGLPYSPEFPAEPLENRDVGAKGANLED